MNDRITLLDHARELRVRRRARKAAAKRARGAPVGNRNALKHGHTTRAVREIKLRSRPLIQELLELARRARERERAERAARKIAKQMRISVPSRDAPAAGARQTEKS